MLFFLLIFYGLRLFPRFYDNYCFVEVFFLYEIIIIIISVGKVSRGGKRMFIRTLHHRVFRYRNCPFVAITGVEKM